MKVRAIGVTHKLEKTELSAEIEGFNLYYRILGVTSPAPRGDGFLAAALIPAMVRGEPLEIDPDAPVSPRLLGGVNRIQDVLTLWNPRLRKIPIRARVEPSPPMSPRTASFFSCGVDSGYTLLKHLDEIDDLILIHGFDISLSRQQLFQSVAQNTAEVAHHFGKACLTVEVNAREFCEHFGMTMALFHGALLASVALMIGRQRTYIPSSYRYHEPEPWGSHILLDENWSTESCEIVHDAAELSRPEKLKHIAASKILMDRLRVCSFKSGEFNCGKCEKCIRTMITLNILGTQVATLPQVPSPRLIKRLPIYNAQQFYFARQNYEMAVREGDVLASRSLKKALRRYWLRRVAKEADQAFFGGRLLKLYRRFSPEPGSSKLVSLT